MNAPRLAPLFILMLALSLLVAACRPQTASPEPRPTLTAVRGRTATPAPTASTPPRQARDDLAFARQARLGRGVNLGNALEAPTEGEWGVTLQAEYFQLIQQQGFQSVRIPIRWSAHAAAEAPYTIDPAFFERIDWAVQQAAHNDLAVILDMHHNYEYMADPDGQKARFVALWQQIAEHYASAPETVYFELLNEPDNQVQPEQWNVALGEALQVVRASNPDRTVIVGPVFWNSLDHLSELKLPEQDRNLIVTFHFYEPFEFTHQGAEWSPDSDQWLGTTWTGSAGEMAKLQTRLNTAAAWGASHQRPLLLGEFGAYSKADMDSRATWTAAVARQAEARGIVWSYWEFCSGFGIYDPVAKTWREPLVKALIP